MKVVMRARISGTRNGVDWPAPGEVVELPDAEAVDMLAAGLAAPVGAAAPETASAPEPETAAAPKPRRRAKDAAGKAGA